MEHGVTGRIAMGIVNKREIKMSQMKKFSHVTVKLSVFFNVGDDIDEDLRTCSIDNNRSKRDISKPISRLSNGSSAYPGSLPYVVRLTFQTFDQFHSDSQACFQFSNITLNGCISF